MIAHGLKYLSGTVMKTTKKIAAARDYKKEQQ